ncbi:MAG: phosphatidylglycerophosphatase A [Methylococcaceae bacterium NSP1-2]|nr:MAG: phosphatidylglycerophosphatase A [Methylococcaceae bacterium NSP1-2]
MLFLAFGFGSGLAKKAPGTCGTVAAIPVYYLFAQANFLTYSLLTIIATVVGSMNMILAVLSGMKWQAI